MNAVKVDSAKRIRLTILTPGDYYEPEVRGGDAEEITLRRMPPPRRRFTKLEALRSLTCMSQAGCGSRGGSWETHRTSVGHLPRTGSALLEDERSVADDLVVRAGGIAGIAQVHGARA